MHAVAFAPREALTGEFLDATTREAFQVAHDISSYSLTALARASLPFMQGRAGSIVALSYLGAVRSIPGYNVMGLAKASLEANVRFLAADLGPAGHPGQRHFRRSHQDPVRRRHSRACAKCSSHVAATAPIKRNVTIDDVGNAAAFLCSDLAAGISGEVLYVDGGFHTVGMSFPADGDGRESGNLSTDLADLTFCVSGLCRGRLVKGITLC